MFSVLLQLFFSLIDWIREVEMILFISLSSNFYLVKQTTVTDGQLQRSFLVHTNIWKADKHGTLIVFPGL